MPVGVLLDVSISAAAPRDRLTRFVFFCPWGCGKKHWNSNEPIRPAAIPDCAAQYAGSQFPSARVITSRCWRLPLLKPPPCRAVHASFCSMHPFFLESPTKSKKQIFCLPASPLWSLPLRPTASPFPPPHHPTTRAQNSPLLCCPLYPAANGNTDPENKRSSFRNA